MHYVLFSKRGHSQIVMRAPGITVLCSAVGNKVPHLMAPETPRALPLALPGNVERVLCAREWAGRRGLFPGKCWWQIPRVSENMHPSSGFWSGIFHQRWAVDEQGFQAWNRTPWENGGMCSPARAAVIKYHPPAGLSTTEMCFSQF